MPKVPNRLYGPAAVVNSDNELFAVAAGKRAVVRHIRILNTTAGALTITLGVGADADGTRLYKTFSIAAGGVEDRWLYLTLEAAETIRATGSAGGLTIVISGDLYTL